ncbi:ATP-binding protein [Clostridium saccharobutylicum]|uniref:histidine kinase n=1 Tax=Clostridium saccharobutylicum TaxID=169679 RepID=A0A1S8NI33_CLOSA|nr:ATP-binding protein [Clostridium saccharobutylicum]OOM16002.1 sensor histidine kinase TmoS [Clostridium saccharobutylicum]
MRNYLGVVVCENFVKEMKLIIQNNNIENVIVVPFVSQCKRNNKNSNDLIQAIIKCEKKCDKIIVLGGSCCKNLDKFFKTERYKIKRFKHCFEMIVNKDIVEYFIKQKSYVVSSGWLENWRKNIEQMRAYKESGKMFFWDSAKKITLLDTGIYENSIDKLKEFGEFVKLPYDYIPVGVDFASSLISNNILEWKLEAAKRKNIDLVAKNNSKLADQAIVFELLCELTYAMTEKEAIENVVNLFDLFYASERSVYIPFNDDNSIESSRELYDFDGECVWNDTKNGFILKIAYKNKVLGIMKIYGVEDVSKKEYYMNFAMIIARVCGLSISNSRRYDRQKEVEKLLNQENEKTSCILSSINECVSVIDSEYKFIYNNCASRKILNVDKSVDRNIFEFIHPKHHENVLKTLKDLLCNKEEVCLREMELTPHNKESILVETSSRAIKYDGNWCILNVSRDITERKRAEELREKLIEQSKLLNQTLEYDRLKNEFFANLSHELRTPLNVLYSTLQLLNITSTDENEERIKRYYNIMKQNCFRLLRLINNLIDATKIDSGFYKINLKNQDIISIIEDIVLSVVEYVNKNEIEIIFDTDLEERIMACDADKIERIILNLLSNAIKFTPSNGKIFLNIKNTEKTILVSVKDTGIGIPIEMQKNIFNRFVQVDKSLSRNREGSGIGLSLVKSLVELHGGSIWVESEYNMGTEFIFELPVRILENQEYDIRDVSIANEDKIQRISIEFSDIYD